MAVKEFDMRGFARLSKRSGGIQAEIIDLSHQATFVGVQALFESTGVTREDWALLGMGYEEFLTTPLARVLKGQMNRLPVEGDDRPVVDENELPELNALARPAMELGGWRRGDTKVFIQGAFGLHRLSAWVNRGRVDDLTSGIEGTPWYRQAIDRLGLSDRFGEVRREYAGFPVLEHANTWPLGQQPVISGEKGSMIVLATVFDVREAIALRKHLSGSGVEHALNPEATQPMDPRLLLGAGLLWEGYRADVESEEENKPYQDLMAGLMAYNEEPYTLGVWKILRDPVDGSSNTSLARESGLFTELEMNQIRSFLSGDQHRNVLAHVTLVDR